MQRRQISVEEISSILDLEYRGEDKEINALNYFDYDSQYDSVLSYLYDQTFIEKHGISKHLKAVVTTGELYEQFFRDSPVTCLVSDDPVSDFYFLHNHLARETSFYSYDTFSLKKGSNCSIHESAIIFESVTLGNNVEIHPNVVLHSKTIIGDNVMIRAGAVIGNNSNENKIINGRKTDIDHVGGVRISDNVSVGSNVTIARNLFEGENYIGNNVRIGEQTAVAPVCRILDNVTIGCNSSILGTVAIYPDSYLAPGVNVRNKVTIGKNCLIGMGSNVLRDVPGNEVWLGNPAKKTRNNR